MKQVDYIVVGLGIAGLTFCEQLKMHKKSFIVIDSNRDKATTVSGGVFNPVVLKRFTAAWNADKIATTTLPLYRQLEKRLDISILTDLPVLRIFTSIEEQNDWMLASDKVSLKSFLSTEIIQNENPSINAPFGFGKVLGSGTVNTIKLVTAFRKKLKETGQLITEDFDYKKISETNTHTTYKDIRAKKIVFAEGAGVLQNPFFKKELLVPNKGEYIIVKAPKLKHTEIIKGKLFIIPLGTDLYKVGATYGRDDVTNHTTEIAKEQLVLKLNTMITCPYEVVDQITGVRPTVKDRKPLLGSLATSERKVFFNGLGTRGIMGAPWLAEKLFQYVEKGEALPSEIDIRRFDD